MRNITRDEMQKVNGGAAVSYSDVCEGIWAVHKRRHETTITGTHATLLSEAKRDFNSKLAAHKVNGNMIYHTHSLNPVAI